MVSEGDDALQRAIDRHATVFPEGPYFSVRTRKAFTILETLVVGLILATIAGLLFAAVAPLRARGREVVCASNLRQIYSALVLYRADWPGYDELPGSGDIPVLPIMHTWTLKPYAKSNRIMICPVDVHRVPTPNWGGSYHLNLYKEDYNSWDLGSPYEGIGRQHERLVVRNLALLGTAYPIMICFCHDEYFRYQYLMNSTGSMPEDDRYYHLTRAIQLRLDGSVKVDAAMKWVNYPGNIWLLNTVR